MKDTLLNLIAIVLGLVFAETTAFLAFQYLLPPEWEKARKVLANDQESLVFQNSIGQPYLLYSPMPDFGSGVSSHNSSGFRGKELSVQRSPGSLRVLFLGGSTTYGWTVPFNSETYPQWFGKYLEAVLDQKVEVINAGLPMGTSAEILTHYLFKYKYYAPDWVIINTGGNDATSITAPYYQPDYSNTRRQLIPPKPLTPFGQMMLKSHILSLFLVPATMNYSQPGQLAISNNEPEEAPPINWFKGGPKNIATHGFYQNIRQLLAAIRLNGQKAALIPFTPAPRNGYSPQLKNEFMTHERMLTGLAAQFGAEFWSFPAEIISPVNWVDYCHVNAAGAKEKGQHFAKQWLLSVVKKANNK